MDTREHVFALRSHQGMVLDMLSLPTLSMVATASRDSNISLIDTYIARERLRLTGHKKGVFSLAYNDSHRLLFSAGFEHDAYVWSPCEPPRVHQPTPYKGAPDAPYTHFSCPSLQL
jgi:WD40 repeat protein